MHMIQRNAGKLFLLGLGIVTAYNWRLWQRDKALAERLCDEQALLPKLSRLPKVSALVAAWNETVHIDAHIESFLALGYPDIELVICAGGTDDTLAIAQRYASERVIVLEQQPGEGKQKALARCYEQACGEIIYLTDADCRFDNEALARLVAPIVNEGEQVATGSICPLREQRGKLLPSYLYASDAISASRQPAYSVGLRGANAALTRRALLQVGGLSFRAPTGTDYQLAQRLDKAGIAIRQVSASTVPAEYPETIREYRRKQSRWLRNLIIYGPHYKAKKHFLITFQTIFLGILMVFMPLLSIVIGPIALVGWSLLVLQATFAKLRYVRFTERLYGWPMPLSMKLILLPLTLLSFGIWGVTALDLFNTSRSEMWL